MNKILAIFLLSISVVTGTANRSMAQQGKLHQVALFLPLYLDSAFDAQDNYLYGKNFPRNSIPGLEFYMGAACALDSMAATGQSVKVHVFDIRSSSGSLAKVLRDPVMDSIDLIIAPVSGSDFLDLASVALARKIPFVSASYPNDGGIKNNPNVIIVNAKLNTHVQAIYNYVARNMVGSRIIYVRRKNSADDRISDIFKSLGQTTAGSTVKMETVYLPDNPLPNDIASRLDSLRNNVIITGSLDENFGRNVAVAALGMSKSYPVTLVGMPTWEGIQDLKRNEFRNMPMIWSTTFFNPMTENSWGLNYDSSYRRKTYSKPSDMAYRGYELTWLFINLLQKYDTSLISHLPDREFHLLTEFDFRPITWNKTNTAPDYYENKRVYILRRLNGIITRLN